MMRRFSKISEELVLIGQRWWGTLYWLDSGPLGCEVRHYDDVVWLRAYASLQDEGFLWGHRDFLAWHVLVVEPPHEIGEDFVMIRRHPGVPIGHFYPDCTDDIVEPPAEQLAMLAETVARMLDEATSPSDRLLAELVATRVASRDHRLVFDLGEKRFHLYDLDPTAEELAAWNTTPRDA
ncbi:MAG: hypothetical protein KIT31_27740 [Deltaproteobacteria bacterium]|nr:hypothetical protein [Deltaproteobacteria bacterium]